GTFRQSRIIAKSLRSPPGRFARIWRFHRLETRQSAHYAKDNSAFRAPHSAFVGSPARARLARLRTRRAAEDQGVDQAQHERESLSAIAQSVTGGKNGGGRTAASVSESNRSTTARKAGEVSWVQTGERRCRQRLGW